MIITKTPLKISFIGSYTDHPDWYLKNGCMVIGASINKYVYVIARVNKIIEPSNCKITNYVIEYLKNKKINCDNIVLHHFSDMPCNFDFGYNTSLVIGILKAIYSINNIYKTNHELSIECNEIFKINNLFCLHADSFLSSYGGFNVIKFDRDNSVLRIPLNACEEVIDYFKNNLSIYNLQNSNQETLFDFDEIKKVIESKKDKELWIIKKMSEDSVDFFMSNRYKDIIMNIAKTFSIKESCFYKTNKYYSSDFSSKCIFSKVSAFDISSHNGYGCGIVYSTDSRKNFKLLECFNKIDLEFEFYGSHIIL